MCGIIGVVGASDAASTVIEGLRRLEYRGYDSAGLAVLAPGSLTIVRAVGAVERLAALERPVGTCAIGHTRWATHGLPTEHNAHPHADCTGRLAIVHNGIVENHAALREKLEANGHTFRSDTDTEVLAHLIEEHFAGDLLPAVRAALQAVEGSYAIAVVSADAADRVVVARRRSPLLIGRAGATTLVASDASAILPHTTRVALLEDGDTAELTATGVTLLDVQGMGREPTYIEMAWTPGSSEKGDYAHHTLKEIHEIPQALRDLLTARIGLLGDRFDQQGALTEREIRDARKIVVVACGTSYYAGLMGKSILERLAGVPTEVHLASEYRYAPSMDGSDALHIYVSQSGETADTLEALRARRDQGGRSLAFVNVPHSSLAREADGVFHLRAGPEVAVASTKAFVNMLGGFYLLAIHLGQTRGRIEPTEAQALAAKLQALPHLAARTFERASEIQAAGEEFFLGEAAFFLGRQVSHGLALEGALKLKEISYVHAEGYAAGELKHGPLALLQQGTAVTALLPHGDPTYDVMLGTIREVKARGARVLGLVAEGDEHAAAMVDRVVRLPATEPLFYPVPAAIALYLLAYHAAKTRGCPIDKPRNLAKSVTVE